MRHTIFFRVMTGNENSLYSRYLTLEVSGSLFHLAAVWGTI